MYTIEFPLVSTNSADMTREIVENWVLKLGASNFLSSDHGITFGGKTIQAISRVLAHDKTHTSPYKSKSNGQTERANGRMAAVISNVFAENP